ncbi:MAG: NAD(P)H-dependent oxidoreductase [Rhizobiaceae bacterium]
MPPRILVFNGSTRSGAFSGKVADAALAELARQGAEATRIALSDYPLPIMDEDLEAEKGIPENAYRLARLMAAHDGFFIATPEYNGSIPPLLKNVIDWVSRISRDGERPLRPYAAKAVALASSSNGTFAGIRAINHLRAVLAHIGLQVVSEQCSVPMAQDAFDAMDHFRDERVQKHMEKAVRALIEQASFYAGKRL